MGVSSTLNAFFATLGEGLLDFEANSPSWSAASSPNGSPRASRIASILGCGGAGGSLHAQVEEEAEEERGKWAGPVRHMTGSHRGPASARVVPMPDLD